MASEEIRQVPRHYLPTKEGERSFDETTRKNVLATGESLEVTKAQMKVTQTKILRCISKYTYSESQTLNIP